MTLLVKRPSLRRYAVPDPAAIIQKIRNPGPSGTLRRFHVIHRSWVHTPVILIIFEIGFLTIDQSAKTHLPIERDKKLGERVDVFNPVVDIADRVEIAGPAGRWRPY